MKNSYEYQLYTLETTAAAPEQSVLKRLVELLRTPDTLAQRKALYALSAAARGNTDVQAALLHSTDVQAAVDEEGEGDGMEIEGDGKAIAFEEILYQIVTQCIVATVASPGSGPVDVERKVWSFISDMLEELTFVRTELLDELSAAQREEAAEQLKDVHASLLGARFLTSRWLERLVDRLQSGLMVPKAVGEAETSKAAVRATTLSQLSCVEYLLANGVTASPQLTVQLKATLQLLAAKGNESATSVAGASTGTKTGDGSDEEDEEIEERGLEESSVANRAKQLFRELAAF